MSVFGEMGHFSVLELTLLRFSHYFGNYVLYEHDDSHKMLSSLLPTNDKRSAFFHEMISCQTDVCAVIKRAQQVMQIGCRKFNCSCQRMKNCLAKIDWLIERNQRNQIAIFHRLFSQTIIQKAIFYTDRLPNWDQIL